jgi:Xaa-Pro aminopeptidase
MSIGLMRLVFPCLLATTALAQAPAAAAPAAPAAPAAAAVAIAPIAPTELRARREAVAQAVAKQADGKTAVVLVRGAGKQADMGAFVQLQDFLYLAGVPEPDLAVLLVVGPDGALLRDELLVPPFSRFAATWDGDFLAPGEAAAKRTGFATAGNVRSLHRQLDELLAADAAGARPVLFTLTEPAARTGSTPRKAADGAREMQQDRFDGRRSREESLVQALRKAHDGLRIEGLEPIVHGLRAHKSAAEVAILRRCSELTAAGHAEAMRSCTPGVGESALAAIARLQFSLQGAGPDAYGAIVGGGPNGCILHYNALTRTLRDDDLIVMDYAPTLHGYAVDVTRTFPASGTFSPAQRKLVQDVHDVQQALIREVKPGASLGKIGALCARLLTERGYKNDHGPCHHVGLAVHDPNPDVLAAGMVITVEPGAYLRDVGMGCRIEDTILVTADGCEVLSAGVPSTPDAIEALMAQPGLLQQANGAK